jgi:hypothetical protein
MLGVASFAEARWLCRRLYAAVKLVNLPAGIPRAFGFPERVIGIHAQNFGVPLRPRVSAPLSYTGDIIGVVTCPVVQEQSLLDCIRVNSTAMTEVQTPAQHQRIRKEQRHTSGRRNCDGLVDVALGLIPCLAAEI